VSSTVPLRLADPLAFLERVTALTDDLRARVAAQRENQIAMARVLAELDAIDGWCLLGCVSVGEYAERIGLSAEEGRTLAGFGRGIAASPLLEQQVRDGKITVVAAGLIGDVLADASMLRPEDDWIGWAQSETTKSIRRRVQRRREDVRAGDTPTVPIFVYVKPTARDDFERARVVASRKAERALSPGETFETIVDHYLDCFDEDRIGPGKRRVPHTSLVEGRYVPMATKREVFERQKGQCAVPLCDNTIFLQLAHLVPHASGGHREADNLLLLCTMHHFLFDHGDIRLEGTASSPRFFDKEGRGLTRRFDPPPRAPPPTGGAATNQTDEESSRAPARAVPDPAEPDARPEVPEPPLLGDDAEPPSTRNGSDRHDPEPSDGDGAGPP
jgi:hypothetical protein